MFRRDRTLKLITTYDEALKAVVTEATKEGKQRRRRLAGWKGLNYLLGFVPAVAIVVSFPVLQPLNLEPAIMGVILLVGLIATAVITFFDFHDRFVKNQAARDSWNDIARDARTTFLHESVGDQATSAEQRALIIHLHQRMTAQRTLERESRTRGSQTR